MLKLFKEGPPERPTVRKGMALCRPDEVPKRTEVTKEQVDELRAKGMDSLKIAAQLKATLSEVNKYLQFRPHGVTP